MENYYCVQVCQGIDFWGQCVFFFVGWVLVVLVVDCIFEFGEGEYGGIF